MKELNIICAFLIKRMNYTRNAAAHMPGNGKGPQKGSVFKEPISIPCGKIASKKRKRLYHENN